jgi:hypothetical protein
MRPLRDDHVRVPLSRGTIVLPWASREALLGELRRLDAGDDVGQAFADAKAPAPVMLTRTQKSGLIRAIEEWGTRVDGGSTGGLPPGIVELRDALQDDLDDRPGGRESSEGV